MLMNRRRFFEAAALAGVGAAMAATGAVQASASRSPFVTAKDGTRLFVQDWGTGRPVVLLAAWTFNSSVWGSHIAALNAKGFRCIAPDRRGHGRSEVPMAGYDIDTLADDVASVIEQHDLSDIVLIAHSMGTSEAANYLARYGSHRIGRLVFAAPTTPFLIATDDNPDAVPRAAIEAQNAAIAGDYPKWIADNEAPFFTGDTPPETRTWIKAMMLSVPLPVALACRATLAFADLRGAVGDIDRPTLIVQGDKDASAPLPLTGAKTAKLIRGSGLNVYAGAPHAIVLTHRERFLADALRFIGT
jgi:pimeloyl-ACP methyl ester carboxylesterase